MTPLDQNISGIGALADPVRRALYLFVCAQPGPVSRDRAAGAVGVPQHRAKFHLDRLEAEGLLDTGYARLTGRTGPGAGRTSKLYRRADRDIAVSLPERDYELAGRLMADAIAESTRTGDPVERALDRAAAAHGRMMADDVAADAVTPDTDLDVAVHVLQRNGYEPRREGDRVVMSNCPFHALAQQHTALICGMNHALLTAMTQELAADRLEARLSPRESHCCVVLAPANPDARR